MKKISLLILFILMFTGCKNMSNTPTAKVENFMEKYQSMDSAVLNQLDTTLENRLDLTEEQKSKYKSLMEKQYQNLSYVIKNENIDGNNANVLVEIETYDYRNALNKSEAYFDDNKKEFTKEDGSVDYKKYLDYKIEEMLKVNDRIKNEIVFVLRKEKDKWILEDISDIDREKIHGLYRG